MSCDHDPAYVPVEYKGKAKMMLQCRLCGLVRVKGEWVKP